MSEGDHIELLAQKLNQGSLKALEEMTRLANVPNSSQGQVAFRLGLLHDGTGPMGSLNNLEEARRYYELAAELGHPKAQFFLGNMYEFGEGVQQDWRIARDWYQRAANNGERNSQMNLARILETGRAGVIDIEQSAVWYLEAAKQGDAQAATNLALIHLRSELSASDTNLAVQLLEFSAAKLDGLACLVLGEIYMQGSCVEQSDENATMHLCLAARLLPAGPSLEATKGYLEILSQKQDPSVMEFFVKKAIDYIGYIRGPAC